MRLQIQLLSPQLIQTDRHPSQQVYYWARHHQDQIICLSRLWWHSDAEGVLLGAILDVLQGKWVWHRGHQRHSGSAVRPLVSELPGYSVADHYFSGDHSLTEAEGAPIGRSGEPGASEKQEQTLQPSSRIGDEEEGEVVPWLCQGLHQFSEKVQQNSDCWWVIQRGSAKE